MSALTSTAVIEMLLCGTPTLGDGQVVSFDSSVASSSALAAGVHRISATEDCWYKVAASPTAAANETSAFLKAGAIDFVPIPVGDAYKIAFIKDTTAGKASIQKYEVKGS
ncbi:MAG: hypothetical protein KC503_17440 [Myxococcales bacterium]|nr:hypothetical protein [Myxococcales bacterium]